MTEHQAIHHLEQQLAALSQRPNADIRQQIDVRNDLAWQLSDIDASRVRALNKEAHALAGEPDSSGAAYQAGIAASLRTLGYLTQRLGTIRWVSANCSRR